MAMALDGIFQAMMSEREEKETPKTPLKLAAEAGALKDAFAVFLKSYKFEVGQIVQWKPGMRNKLGQGPRIVTKILDKPEVDTEHDSGSSYFKEPLDIILGEINGGEFVEHYHDSRRFEPYTGPMAEDI